MSRIEIFGGPFDGKLWLLEGMPYLGTECKFVDLHTGDVYLYEAKQGPDGRLRWFYVRLLDCKKATPFSCEMAVWE